MKKIKCSLLFAILFGSFLSCTKPEAEAETCEDTNTSRITYVNTTNASLRVVVSHSLNSQFEPVNPLFSIDLAPGQSVVKDLVMGRYVNSWYNSCPSNCNRRGSTFRDYAQCNEYEEKQ